METELRLATSTGAAATLWKTRALAALAVSPSRVRRLQSIYWDTPDLRLRAQQMSLRVRRGDGVPFRQTLKTAARDVDTRGEYEAALTSPRPSLGLARDAGWPGDVDADAIERALEPLFRTEIVRTSRDVRFDDGTVAEVVIDRGSIVPEARASRSRVRVIEIEIELKSGRAARLYELAWRLVRELPATRITFASKSDRGYDLLPFPEMPARRAHAIVLPGGPTPQLLAVRAFAESVAHVQRNVERARNPGDAEGVHQMRVGLRRLRVGAQLARHADLPSMSERLADDVRWLWALLGVRRDADVFITQAWPQVERDAARPDAPTALFAREHHQARRSLVRALASRRFSCMMLEIGWIAALQAEALDNGQPRRGARRFARQVLERRAKQVSAKGRVDRLGDDARHHVRIEAKKLRYVAEFTVALFDARAAKRYLRRLANVQAALGALNDLAVMRQSLETVAAALPADEGIVVVSMGSDYRTRHAPALEAALAKAWRKFENAPPFWRQR